MDLPVLVGIAEYEGAVESALDTASLLLADARKCLDVLSESEWRNGLEEVTYYLEGLLNKCRR